jgi:NAD+ synthase (glutamine-hydrolysing)
MHTFRVALAQINTTVGDLEGNLAKTIHYIDQARSLGADLVAFPELTLTGYPPEDLLLKSSFLQSNVEAMKQAVAASKGIAVVVGFVDVNSDIYNASAVGYDGKLAGIYRKIRLPTYGVFDEERYFGRGDSCPVFTMNGVGVGINVCEDIWYTVGPTEVQRSAGAYLIVNTSASPYGSGKRVQRERMLATRAADNELFVAYVNLVGGQDELVFDGGSVIFGPNGELVARAEQFEEKLLITDLDTEAVFRSRLHDPRTRQEISSLVREVAPPDKVFVSQQHNDERPPLDRANGSPLEPTEEVYKALVLGTRDYVRKIGLTKVVVGLSGGIDSALTACIAADALGKENVVGVVMPSRYSSEASITDSKELAQNLGIGLWEIPLEPAHQAYLKMLEPPLDGVESTVVEENIQARIRGNILMAISNKFGWLVLTTGNKSEYSVGYATLYGDMAGGFAVIKDVPKILVYELSRWRNANTQPLNAIPNNILEKAPSAELRPNQKDEDSLPPYSILDPILKAYVEEDRSYPEIVQMGFDAETVKRVIALVDRSEYKRRQSPPGVKITPRAFGRDRRLPIVNQYRQF